MFSSLPSEQIKYLTSVQKVQRLNMRILLVFKWTHLKDNDHAPLFSCGLRDLIKTASSKRRGYCLNCLM